MTEIIKDMSFGFPPLNRLLARRMIEETKVYQLLKGYRGQAAANLELLEEIRVTGKSGAAPLKRTKA